MTEIAIIGSDIQEVIGSATALKILFGIPIGLGALITIFDSFLFLFIHYYGVRKLEAFFMVLVSIMAICFGINMFESKPDYSLMFGNMFVPTDPIPSEAVQPALGLVGAVIMPHNIYLHSALVLSRKINMKSKNEIRDATIYNNIESAFSLFISIVISTFVISTFAVYITTPDWLNRKPEDQNLDLESASVAL